LDVVIIDKVRNMSATRPAIPSDIQLKVRQKCKFGCVICGCPIYQYNHLEEWSVVREHKEENIFLLCPTHHSLKTIGAISKEYILERFYKLDREQTKPQDLYITDFTVMLGNNEIHALSGSIFDILGKDHFDIKLFQGRSFINCEIYNSDSKPAFQIENSFYTCFTNIWDIKKIGKTTSFRNKKSDRFFEITIDNENREIKILGKFYFDDSNYIWVKNDGIFYKGHCLASGCRINGVSKFCFIITKSNHEIGNGVGYKNCRNIYSSISKNNRVAFAWSLDSLLELS
jgi:hypothetical protein